MEVMLGCFCSLFQVVPVGRKLRGSLTLHGILVFTIGLSAMALPSSGAPAPSPARGCPLDMNREELQYLCKNLALPPLDILGNSSSSSERPPTCCQLSMNFWVSKLVNSSDGESFFLSQEAADNCINTFNNEWLPTLGLPVGQCVPLNSSFLARSNDDPCQRMTSSSNLTSISDPESWKALDNVCASNLTDDGLCNGCGKGILQIVTKFAKGFPLPTCVTAVTILMGSRDPIDSRWSNLSTCVGNAVFGSFGPPGAVGVPAPAPAAPRLLPPLPPPKSDSPNTITTIIGVVLGASVFAAIVAIIFFFILSKRKTKKASQDIYLKNGDDESSPPSRLLLSGHLEHAQLQPYLFSELQAATNNFAEGNRVGTGGSADVYKGVLPNGNVVAIKKLLKVSLAEREFLNEIAVVATLKHRNLATLIGYSESNLGFLLVFDFYPNGSMEDAIFDEEYPKRLTWGQCVEVVVGAAKGIMHLHGLNIARTNQQKVIHRDIKPSNILLDSEFQACVADFGVSRNLQLQQTHVTTKIMGTFGYVAPEYAGTGKLTEKSDVYSFGVTMLVVMSKKQPAGLEMSKLGSESLVEYAFSLARKEQMLLMISTDYEGQFTIDEAERFLSVALLCVQPVPQMRPTFDKIVLMLEGRDDVPPVPIPAARSASSMLPGLKRLIFGGENDTNHTGISSTYTSTTTLESLDSTQTFDRKLTGSSLATSYEACEGTTQRSDTTHRSDNDSNV